MNRTTTNGEACYRTFMSKEPAINCHTTNGEACRRAIYRTIGVNLRIFHGISWERFYRCRPYRAKELGQTQFYTDTVATRLKRVLKSSRFPRRIRFGWETEPTGLGEND